MLATDHLRNVSVDYDALISFTRDLVRIPSVNRPDDGLNEAPAAALVADLMRSFGWTPIVEEVAPGRPNVIAIVEGGRPGPTLLFEGHTDVVTEGDPDARSHDPFGADIVDGRLYGRGAADMKSGLAAALYATAAVAAAGPFPGRIVLAALVDEEGMMLGAKEFVARGHAANVDAAIVCEPEGGEVCTTQKGAMRIQVTAVGRMAHGAMPDHGLNPISALGDFTLKIAQIEHALQEKLGRHPHLGLPFLTPTFIEAGDSEQLNVIPPLAQMGIDVRTVPAVDHAALQKNLRAAAREVTRATGVKLDLEVIDDRPPTETPVDAPVVQAVIEAHEAITGLRPPLGGVPGTTDGTILWRDARVPIVVYGPGGKWVPHQVDECVSVAEIKQAADVYALAALSYLIGEARGEDIERSGG